MSKTLHQKLVEQVAGEIARQMLDSMPRIAESLQSAKRSASFTATVQFTTDAENEPTMEIKCRERIPLEPIKYELQRQGEQLKLGQLRLVEVPDEDDDDAERGEIGDFGDDRVPA